MSTSPSGVILYIVAFSNRNKVMHTFIFRNQFLCAYIDVSEYHNFDECNS